MDEELQELAALALRNAFWTDFSALVNKYLEAAEGLNVADQEMQMGEMTSIYGRDTTADDTEISPNIWTQNGANEWSTTGHGTILEALMHEPATEVHLRGNKIFEKVNGEWMWVSK